jgi:hypothetical protein
MCDGGSLGPVGSPGWRRREAWGREMVKLRDSNWGFRRMREVALRVVVVGDMVDRWERYDGEALVVCAALFSLACVG